MHCWPVKPLVAAFHKWESFQYHELKIISPEEVIISVSYELIPN